MPLVHVMRREEHPPVPGPEMGGSRQSPAALPGWLQAARMPRHHPPRQQRQREPHGTCGWARSPPLDHRVHTRSVI